MKTRILAAIFVAVSLFFQSSLAADKLIAPSSVNVIDIGFPDEPYLVEITTWTLSRKKLSIEQVSYDAGVTWTDRITFRPDSGIVSYSETQPVTDTAIYQMVERHWRGRDK